MTVATALGLDHVDLSVGDMVRSVAFYDAVLTALGFRQVDDSSTVVWHSPAMEIGIRAARSPAPPGGVDRYRVGLHHLAFRVAGRDDVDRFHAFLLESGFPVLDPPASYPDYEPGYYAVFFADPDGMKLEVVCRDRDAPA